eukprot:6492413-Amphidinium_carterae.4
MCFKWKDGEVQHEHDTGMFPARSQRMTVGDFLLHMYTLRHARWALRQVAYAIAWEVENRDRERPFPSEVPITYRHGRKRKRVNADVRVQQESVWGQHGTSSGSAVTKHARLMGGQIPLHNSAVDGQLCRRYWTSMCREASKSTCVAICTDKSRLGGVRAERGRDLVIGTVFFAGSRKMAWLCPQHFLSQLAFEHGSKCEAQRHVFVQQYFSCTDVTMIFNARELLCVSVARHVNYCSRRCRFGPRAMLFAVVILVVTLQLLLL